MNKTNIKPLQTKDLITSSWIIESFFMISFAFCCLYFFYSSPMKIKLENMLSDFSTRAYSYNKNFKHSAFLDISLLENESQSRSEYYFKIIQQMKLLASHSPKMVILVMDPPYEQDLAGLVDFTRTNPEFYIGVFDLTATHIETGSIPPVLQRAKQQIISIDPQNYARKKAVRNFPILDRSSKDSGNYAAAALLKKIGYDQRPKILQHLDSDQLIQHSISDQQSLHFRLNFAKYPMRPYYTFSSNQSENNTFYELIRDKIVIVSPTKYREVSTKNPVPNFANTPFQGDGAEIQYATPVSGILWNALENIAAGSWVRVPDPDINIGFMFIVIFMTLLLFVFLNAPLALIVLVLLWMSLIFLNGLLSSHFHFRFFLAEAFAYSSIIAIGFGIWRIRRELNVLSNQQAKLASEIELTKLQDRFLEDLGKSLKNENHEVYQLLQKYEVETSDKVTTKFYESAKEASQDLDHFLNSVESVSNAMRKSSQRNFGLPSTVSLKKFCIKIFNSLKDSNLQKTIHLKIDVPENFSCKTNEWILEQLLFNLFSNCFNYCPDNSTVFVELIQSSPLVIHVSDDGMGIPSEEADKIFAKFYRIKNDQNYTTKGHGIGLYLSRFFAQAVGGDLKLLSNEVSEKKHKGACFEIKLPASTLKNQFISTVEHES